MRESDLIGVWEEALQRMRACFDFAEAQTEAGKADKSAQDKRLESAAKRRGEARTRETGVAATPNG